MSIQPIAANAAVQPPEAARADPVRSQEAPASAQPRRIEPAFDRYVSDGQGGKMPRVTPPKAERTTTDTDKVDREIEALKRKLEELQSRLSAAAPEEREALERQADQVRRELEQKDNDGYRRQNAVIRFSEVPVSTS